MECDACQRKETLKKAKKPLQPVPVPNDAFTQVGMDLVGPLEESTKGKTCIFKHLHFLKE